MAIQQYEYQPMHLKRDAAPIEARPLRRRDAKRVERAVTDTALTRAQLIETERQAFIKAAMRIQGATALMDLATHHLAWSDDLITGVSQGNPTLELMLRDIEGIVVKMGIAAPIAQYANRNALTETLS